MITENSSSKIETLKGILNTQCLTWARKISVVCIVYNISGYYYIEDVYKVIRVGA